MTNAKQKAIRQSRKALNNAKERYFKSGDVNDMFTLLEKQSALSDAYADDSMRYDTI